MLENLGAGRSVRGVEVQQKLQEVDCGVRDIWDYPPEAYWISFLELIVGGQIGGPRPIFVLKFKVINLRLGFLGFRISC